MNGKIDYKKYLAGLGEVNTNQKQIIKKYLEEQCEKDEVLKSLYRPEKLDDCYDFIMNAVRDMPRDGQWACIEGGLVFKIARDFYIEILPTIADTPPEVSAATKEEPTVDISKADISEVSEEMNKDAAEDKIVRDKYGFEIYGETEEPEEKEEEKPCHQEKEEIKINDDLLNGLKYETGKIIDKPGRKIENSELFKGLHFVFADYAESFDYLVVMEIQYVDQELFSYCDGKHTMFCYFDNRSKGNPLRDLFAIPDGASVTGEYDYKHNKRVMYSDPEQMEDKTVDEDGNYLLFGF